MVTLDSEFYRTVEPVYNTVRLHGVVIRTTWDEYHAGPIELVVTIDHSRPLDGMGITDSVIRRLSLREMLPESMKAIGSLKVVGGWIENNKAGFRARPANPETFYAHVALFVVLACQDNQKGVLRILANYAGVRVGKAKEWVSIARRLGMLTARSCNPGRAYGSLTDKARSVLGSQSEINDAA